MMFSIGVGQIKQRFVYCILYDKDVQSRPKDKFYIVIIRPYIVRDGVLINQAYSYLKNNSSEIDNIEMNMYVDGHIRKDKIKNEYIQYKVRVTFEYSKKRKVETIRTAAKWMHKYPSEYV